MRNRDRWAGEKSLRDIVGGDIAPNALRKRIGDMDAAERRQLRRAFAKYRRANARETARIQNELSGVWSFGLRGLKELCGGAAIGISVACFINTVMPGFFTTNLGFIAGSLRGTELGVTLSKLGLVTIGYFAPPALTQSAILMLGALVGAIPGLLWQCVRGIVRLIRRGVRGKQRTKRI